MFNLCLLFLTYRLLKYVFCRISVTLFSFRHPSLWRQIWEASSLCLVPFLVGSVWSEPVDRAQAHLASASRVRRADRIIQVEWLAGYRGGLLIILRNVTLFYWRNAVQVTYSYYDISQCVSFSLLSELTFEEEFLRDNQRTFWFDVYCSQTHKTPYGFQQ